MCVDLDAIVKRLRAARAAPSTVPARPECGIYAWFMTNNLVSFGGFSVPSDGLIYVGSSSNLAGRELEQHLSNTSSSSLRRSLSAILKDKLGRAIPRSINPTDSKRFTHYRFSDASEIWLTTWMRSNLDLAIVACEDYVGVEGSLIRRLQPLLCLKGWDNPNRPSIKALRKVCADEARASA